MKFSNLISRIEWGTTKRKDRTNREQSYKLRFGLISGITNQIWEIVYPNDPPLQWKGGFTKYDAAFCFFAVSGGVESDGYYLGLDQDNAYDFQYGSCDSKLSYWTCEEVLAAGIIAEIKSKSITPPQELVETILAQYFIHEGIDAAGQSETWMHRLNSVVCSLWQMSNVFAVAQSIAEEEGLQHMKAFDKAMAITPKLELPMCYNSPDGVGRHNISYSANGSCFYTIDFAGEAVCKEYPNERLNLAEYETMLRVACTIVRDMRQGDESGLADAMFMMKDEPEWKNGCIMPETHEDQLTKMTQAN